MRPNSYLLQLFLTLFLLLGLSKPDPDPLQDYCVADTKTPKLPLFLNGVPCIDPKQASSSHFATSALSKPGNTSANMFGFSVTLTTTINLPGLNTMGLTLARIDIAADGIVPPHWHPRASEVTTCLQGALLVGFVDNLDRLFTQQLRAGESFVFPKGLIHFLSNLDSSKPALAVSGFNSQNPGGQIASVVSFTSKPAIPDEILKKAFKINGQDVTKMRRNLGG
ncbi:Germin-like protein subfamily 1 member 1 [Quillaja saponaria]|uniref:Germin-like protein n=1 Tax=Quillaja saponaria TaxID=32244 RepID=A0AAD7KRE5_QUISA|nr:Germin-like protein subfamily 1 member 1 [Quillaja saponaria]